MKRKLAYMALTIGLLGVPAYSDFRWAGGTYYYEDDAATPLTHDPNPQAGAFVQLIWDVSGDGIDGIVASGTGVMGDDLVFATTWFGEDTKDSAYDGIFWYSGFRTTPMGEEYDNEQFYARVFDSPVLSYVGVGTAIPLGPDVHYWNGALFTYDNRTPPAPQQVYNMSYGRTAPDGLVYITEPIPEPATALLFALGLVTIRGARIVARRRKA